MEIMSALAQAPIRSNFIGRQFFAGYQLPIVMLRFDSAGPIRGPDGYFGLLHVTMGTALLDGAAGPIMVSAPSVILLDENSAPTILRTQNLCIESVYFDPIMINSVFTPALLRAVPVLEGTVEQDAYLLRRFIEPGVTAQPLLISATLHRRIGEAIQRVRDEASVQGDEHWPCRTRSWLIEMLFQLRVANPQVEHLAAPETALDRLDQVLLYVHERFNTEFTLDDVARWCASNRTQVNRRFRELTGQSLRQYVINLRMRVASSLLRDTGLPITEIMTRVGYENGSNFSRTFRAAFAQTPREHRRGI